MHPHGNGTLNVDAALHDVARIYRSITGRELPNNGIPMVPIPPEREPRKLAESALEGLARLLQRIEPGGLQQPPAGPIQMEPQAPAQQVHGAAVDCWESGKTLHVHVDLPGVRREQIALALEAGMLVIRAQRNRETPDGARAAALERPCGVVERRIALPGAVDANGVEAELRDGVLRVRLHRVDGSDATRSIPIR